MLLQSILMNSFFAELQSNPIIALALFGVVSMFLGVLPKVKDWILTIGLFGLLAAWSVTVMNWNTHIPHFAMLTFDNFSLAFLATAIAFTILIFLLTDHKEYEEIHHRAEFYALFFFSLCGVALMLSFSNLLMLFIGIEILSVSLYIMAGFRKKDLLSNEASLKYFLMGAFATGFLLLGIALVYGSTGSFDLAVIHAKGKMLGDQINPLYSCGIILLIVAMGFKVSAAPFHFWAPDVYQGAPTTSTAFMSTVVKIAGFGAFYRLMYGAFEYSIGMWSATIIAMIVLTLLIGNLIATRQHNFKRMLAYSSISHAGFMLMTILCVAGLHNGATANLLLYVVGYGAASIIAFTVLQLVHYKTGSDEMEAFNGLAKRNPFLAVSLVIAMCSMAGIPLTAGFFGKFYMLSSIVEQGYLWLAIAAVLCSAISFYYYFMVIKAMYSKESETENIQINPSHLFVLIVCLAAIFVFGIAPFIIRGLLTV
ncbi:MAG: hypothetical protein RJA07_2435 [Bacteroidota bacterium]